MSLAEAGAAEITDRENATHETRLEVDKNANFCLIVASRYHLIIGAAQSKPPLRIARKTLTWDNMTAKVEIVKRLGEQAVLLPSLIAEALNANDRIKITPGPCYRRRRRMHRPWVGGAIFQAERMRRLVGPPIRSHYHWGPSLDGDRIAIPGVTLLLAGIPVDYGAMLAPSR